MKSYPRFASIVLAIMFLTSAFSVLAAAQESQVWQRTEVDSSGNVGDFNSIAIDADDGVHISYYDASNQQLKYATNAGGSWKSYLVDQGSNETLTGQHTSIAVDSSNQVHIAYTSAFNGTTSLKFASGSGGNWTKSFVDFANSNGTWIPSPLNPNATTSLALDSNGQAFISCQASSGKLQLVTNAGGTWSNYTLIGNNDTARGGDFNSIAIDGSDNLFIAYHATVSLSNTTVSNLSLLTNSPGSWTNVTVDSSGSVGTYNSIKIGTPGIQIAYRSESSGSLKYATSKGTNWTVSTVASGDTGYYTSLAVDGGTQIVCENRSDLSLDYFSLDSSGTWTEERVWNHGNSIGRCSLAANSTGGPQIAIQNPEGKNLVYIHRQGAGPAPGTVPSAPQNLTATVNKTVVLNWSAPNSSGNSSISSYHLYRNGSLIANLTGTQYNDTNVTPGATYTYNVSAVNAFGEGPNATVNVTIPSPSLPSAPQNLKAQAGAQEVNLTWNPPASTGGSPITSYRIYRNGSLIANLTGTSYSDANVTPGQSYGYGVSAVNSAGEGPNATASVNLTAAKSTPSAPLDLKASPGEGSVALTWSPPANNGSSPITSYRIYRNGSAIATVNATEYNDTNVTNGIEYTYAVSAFNSVGEGNKSETVTATPTALVGLPGAPQNLTFVAGNQYVVLSWKAPSSDGGSTITDYRIYRDDNFVEGTGSGSNLTFNLTGLVNGKTYTLGVSAVNSAGEGPKATVEATPRTVPSAVQNLNGTALDGNVSLTWEKPAEDGGSPITSYHVFRDGSLVANTTNASFIDTGLKNGQSYKYAVAAVNAVGEGANTSITLTPVPSVSVPSAPQNLTAKGMNSSVNLSWNPPLNDGNSSIVDYRVYRNGSFVGHVGSGTRFFFNDTGLVNGQTYHYNVSAVNKIGEGANASVDGTPSTVPGAPTLNTATPGNGQIALTWAAPSDDGGSAITGYQIIWKLAGGNETIIEVGNTLTFTHTNLTQNTTYYYQISAVNANGAGARSAQVSATTWSVPNPPSLTAIWGNGGVTLEWTTPQSPAPIDYYVVYRNGTDIAHVTSTTYFDANVSIGTQYQYVVRAHNVVGLSAPSNVQIIVSPNLPSAPEVSIIEGSGYLLLDWTVAYDGGSTITNYTIYRGTESGNLSVLATINDTTTYNDTTVVNEVTYYYVVAAVNEVGQGPNSLEVNGTPFSPIPPQCRIETNLTSGNVGTEFNFSVVVNVTVQVRWDFENDGVWDTDWLNTTNITHSYNKTGSYVVKCEVRDKHNLTSSATSNVSVGTTSPGNNTPLILIGIVVVLAVIAVIGLYIMRKRGI